MAMVDFKLFKQRMKSAWRIGIYVCRAPLAIFNDIFEEGEQYRRNLERYKIDKKNHEKSELIPEKPDWKIKNSDDGSD